MYQLSEDCPIREIQIAGGKGLIRLKDLAAKDAMYSHARMFAHVVVPPKCSIGTHTHEHETEFYYILKGEAVYHDNGTDVTLHPGDVTATGYGHSHGLENQTDAEVELIALIMLE